MRLQESLATELEALVIGISPKPTSGESTSNPDWTRDELILALNFYLQHRPNPPGKDSQEIRALSEALGRLGDRLFPATNRGGTFRNENGVYMKLMNFRRLDPLYTADGKTGLGRGAKAEEEVWATFAQDPLRCQQVAKAIMASLDDPEFGAAWLGPDTDDGIQEAAEGRLLTRMHIARERNRQLVESKRKQAMKLHGKLVCEVCDFDFAIPYPSPHGPVYVGIVKGEYEFRPKKNRAHHHVRKIKWIDEKEKEDLSARVRSALDRSARSSLCQPRKYDQLLRNTFLTTN